MKDRKILTPEEYDTMMKMSPEERTNDFGDAVTNRIMGILIAYAKKYDMREGWIDIITTGDAEKEIKKLILDCNGDLAGIDKDKNDGAHLMIQTLHSFNMLNTRMLYMIRNCFDVDAFGYCNKNGITYDV